MKTVTCARCGRVMEEVDMGAVFIMGGPPPLYDGVVCTVCHRTECTDCKKARGRIDAPCSWCGGSVQPAYENLLPEVAVPAPAAPSRPRKPAAPPPEKKAAAPLPPLPEVEMAPVTAPTAAPAAAAGTARKRVFPVAEVVVIAAVLVCLLVVVGGAYLLRDRIPFVAGLFGPRPAGSGYEGPTEAATVPIERPTEAATVPIMVEPTAAAAGLFRPGRYVGDDPFVLLEVDASGAISLFAMVMPFGFGATGQQTCTVDLPEPVMLDAEGAFMLTEIVADLGNIPAYEITGHIEGKTASGDYMASVCGNQMISPPSEGAWHAEWQNEIIDWRAGPFAAGSSTIEIVSVQAGPQIPSLHLESSLGLNMVVVTVRAVSGEAASAIAEWDVELCQGRGGCVPPTLTGSGGEFGDSATAAWVFEVRLIDQMRLWLPGGVEVALTAPEQVAEEAAPTTAPAAVAGIDTPITVSGVTFQLFSAVLQETYEFYGQMQEPTRPEDTLLAVEAKLIAGEQDGIFDWEVTVEDENGRQDVAGITGVGTTDGGDPEILWLFAVDETSRSFVLSLPDGVTIDLAPLLGSAPAAFTPQPRPTPAGPASTIAPTATAAGLAPPLLPLEPFDCPSAQTEDFSAAASTFGQGSAGFADWGVVSGEYRFVMKLANSDVRRAPGFRAENALVEVDARRAAAGPGAFGLIFGMDNAGERFYAFVVDAEGYYYALYRYSPIAGWVSVKDFAASPLLNPAPASNHLTAVRSGPLIALYANGLPLQTTLYDDTYTGELDTGLLAWSNESAGLEARFDNFSVCTLTEPVPMPVNPLLQQTVRWAPDQPVLLYFTWLAAEQGLASAFADAAAITVSVDGETYGGLQEYWGAPQPYEYGYLVEWELPLPALSSGTHRIEIVISLSDAVTDGFDTDSDGQQDVYGPGETFSGWVELDVRP